MNQVFPLRRNKDKILPLDGRKARAADPKTQREKLVKEMDDIVSAGVKRRDKYRCQWPGCTWKQTLNCCHFKSRAYKAVRWDPENVVTFCVGHHRYTERNPDEFAEFMILRLGRARFDSLILRRDNKVKMDPKSLEFRKLDVQAEWGKL